MPWRAADGGPSSRTRRVSLPSNELLRVVTAAEIQPLHGTFVPHVGKLPTSPDTAERERETETKKLFIRYSCSVFLNTVKRLKKKKSEMSLLAV